MGLNLFWSCIGTMFIHTCFPCHMHLIFWACVNSQVGVRGTYFVKWLCISWNLKRTRMGLQKTFHCPWIDSTELMVNRFAVVILYYFMLELIKLKNMPTLLIIIVPYRHTIGKCFGFFSIGTQAIKSIVLCFSIY